MHLSNKHLFTKMKILYELLKMGDLPENKFKWINSDLEKPDVLYPESISATGKLTLSCVKPDHYFINWSFQCNFVSNFFNLILKLLKIKPN